MGTGKTAARNNYAPVADHYDKRGVRIDAGTVGDLTFIAMRGVNNNRRGWIFIAHGSDFVQPVKASDLFRFVPRSELASATLGHDAAAGEAIRCAYCCDLVDPLEVFPTGPLIAGSACLGCYRVYVFEKSSDAENFSAMMSAFGGGAVRR